MRMLEGKKLLITGVINRESIAFEVARQAQEAGAEIVLTGFGRAKRMTDRSAARLPDPPDVLEMDVNEPAQIEAVAADLRERWGRVDGVLHAIAFAPEDALGGRFLTTPPESAVTAFQTSASDVATTTCPAGNTVVATQVSYPIRDVMLFNWIGFPSSWQISVQSEHYVEWPN